MRTVCLLIALIAGSAEPAQTQQRAEILVIGTFHMANPGSDVHNTVVDDVLSPKRQREITELLDVLKRFRPTKIAIEASATSQRTRQQYADFLAGRYTLTRNENDQIGYRLGRELGHATVHAVDVDGDFPFLRVRNYARANGKGSQFDSLQATTGRKVAAQSRFLREHTILETLELMNSDSAVASDVAGYFALVPFGEPWEYAGPDLLASWYQRNIRIYHNITRLVDSPNERILVIYGGGHLGWLRQNVASDATVKLRKLSDFTAR